MTQAGPAPPHAQLPNGFSLALVGVIGRVGCLTFVLVIFPLAVGLYLDMRFDTQPLITILMVLASFPLTIFLIYRLVLRSTAGLPGRATPDKAPHEEVERGGNP